MESPQAELSRKPSEDGPPPEKNDGGDGVPPGEDLRTTDDPASLDDLPSPDDAPIPDDTSQATAPLSLPLSPVDDPVPQVVVPLPQQATPEQLARIMGYYGTRGATPLGVGFSVDVALQSAAVAIGYVTEGLQTGGISAGAREVPSTVGEAGANGGGANAGAANAGSANAAGADAGAANAGSADAAGADAGGANAGSADAVAGCLATLQVEISGDVIPAGEHYYGRAALHLVYRTGPGKRLAADAHVRGTYRLSQVSPSDAVLRSLRAIPAAVYAEALAFLDEAWSADVNGTGLPYQVEDMQRGTPHGALSIFEIPPRLQSYMSRHFKMLPHQYTIDPLTGTIKIFYNSDS